MSYGRITWTVGPDHHLRDGVTFQKAELEIQRSLVAGSGSKDHERTDAAQLVMNWKMRFYLLLQLG